MQEIALTDRNVQSLAQLRAQIQAGERVLNQYKRELGLYIDGIVQAQESLPESFGVSVELDKRRITITPELQDKAPKARRTRKARKATA